MPDPLLLFFAGNGTFPHPINADESGICCLSKSLTAADILLGYRFGLFPLNEPDEPIIWWSPDPRWLLDPLKVKVQKSMRSKLNSDRFQLRADTQFDAVINYCAAGMKRKTEGTWIDQRIIQAYTDLFIMGRAHSLEVYSENELIAGFYGVQVGRIFVGESMFTHVTDGSKYALIKSCQFFSWLGIRWVDCQMHSHHLERMGALPFHRKDYLQFLRKEGFQSQQLTCHWTALLNDFLNKESDNVQAFSDSI